MCPPSHTPPAAHQTFSLTRLHSACCSKVLPGRNTCVMYYGSIPKTRILMCFPVYPANCAKHRGPGSVVGIATGYGLDGPGIESRWRGGSEIFRTCPDRPWGTPSLLYNEYRVFPGGKKRPGRDADPSPPSCAVVKKG